MRATATPRTLRDFLDVDLPPIGLRPNADDVPGELPLKIAAWNPGRQREALLGHRVLDVAKNFKVMPIQIGQPNGVTNHQA